jgi:hypothetical protein
MTEAYDDRHMVGMDLHRIRSVLVRMTEDGRRLGTARITNSALELVRRDRPGRGAPAGGARGDVWLVLSADVLAAAGAHTDRPTRADTGSGSPSNDTVERADRPIRDHAMLDPTCVRGCAERAISAAAPDYLPGFAW